MLRLRNVLLPESPELGVFMPRPISGYDILISLLPRDFISMHVFKRWLKLFITFEFLEQEIIMLATKPQRSVRRKQY
jgi:hypothetical protein